VGGAKAVAGLAFSPDGSRLAVSAVRAAVFDVATGRQVLALPGKADTYGRIAWGGGEKYLGVGTRLELWHAATGSPARPPLEPPDGGPDPHRPSSTGMRGVGASFGPDGRYFAATLGQQEGVAVWEVATGRVLRQIAREDRTVYFSGLAFHPDGVRLAVGTAKQGWTPPGTVTEWDVATGAKVRTYEAARDGVTCVAYSPGGEYLAASTGRPRAVTSVPGQVRVWDTATGEEVFTLDGHRTAVWSVAFNRDGSRLASAGNTYMSTVADRGEMVIWDLRTGLPVFRYDGRAKDANAVAFSPCGRYLACAYTEGRVRVYDATPLAETPAYQPLPDDH
jgi:WD40 repeat protein